MKIGIISDSHIDYIRMPRLAKAKDLAIESVLKDIDCLIMCGDNTNYDTKYQSQRRFFENIRLKSSIPIAFVNGNHELFDTKLLKGITSDIIKELMQPYSALAKEYGLIHLEDENLVLNDITICGTYGHYDGTLSETVFPEDNKTVLKLINNLEDRTNSVSKKILVTHSVPNKAMIGVPDGPIQNKYTPFAGSLELQNMIQRISPQWHFCGHTHAYVYSKIGSTESFNVGTGYTNFFYFILDTENYSVIRQEKYLQF
jgi:Icc-related predicted phosphoesterase